MPSDAEFTIIETAVSKKLLIFCQKVLIMMFKIIHHCIHMIKRKLKHKINIKSQGAEVCDD